MTIREQLAREIEQTPDALVEEILDFCLFIKQRKAKEQPNESGEHVTLLRDQIIEIGCTLCKNLRNIFSIPLRC
jgi:hypothetical protein